MMQSKLKYRALDILSVIREPLLGFFVIMPPMAAIMLRILVSIAAKLLQRHLGFDLMIYSPYIQSMVMFLSPLMLGMLTAFVMLDEMDLGLMPLMRTMPGSLKGYLVRRLALPVILTLVYTPLCLWIMGMMPDSMGQMVWLLVLSMMETIFFTSLIFSNATDKVAGLAIAKASGLFILPCFATLLDSAWTLWVARITPLYYVCEILRVGLSVPLVVGALVVNLLWLVTFFLIMRRRIRSLH